MKKTVFIPIFLIVALLASIFFVSSKDNNASQAILNYELPAHWAKAKKEKKKLSKDARIDGYNEWRLSKLINPATGVFDPNDHYAAIAKANNLSNNNFSRNSLNLQWEYLGPDNQGGRTRAILFDKDDPNLIFSGGVAGGMFKSTNRGLNWEPINSYQGFSSVVSIAQGNDNQGTIYVGTGEGLANLGATSLNSGNIGNGIWRTRDKGETWEHLEATNLLLGVTNPGVPNPNQTWSEVNDLLVSPVNPDLLLVATANGVSISTNATDINENVSFTNAQGMNGRGQSLSITQDGTVAYATVSGRTFRSADFTNNFTTGWTQMPVDNGQRADVKVAPSNSDYVYVSISNTAGCMVSIWRSTDAGNTWTKIVDGGPPYVLDPFNQPTIEVGDCQGQGWYDHTLCINPVDEDKIYLGGITTYAWGSGTGGIKKIDIIETEGGSFFDPKYIHADKHKIIFSPHDETGNTMLIGSDGGLSISTNANSGFPDNINFQHINKNYITYQCYGMGAGKFGEVLAGSQDNGTMYVDFQRSSIQGGISVSGGDGGYAEISHFDPNFLFSTSQFGALRRSNNRGESAISFVDENISKGCGSVTCNLGPGGDCPANGDAGFVTVFHLMETSNKSNPLETAILRAKDDTLLLADGSFLIERDTLLPNAYMVESGNAPVEFEVILGDTLFPGETASFLDPYDSKYFVSSTSCGIWMCANPLSGGEPVFYRLTQGFNALNYDHSFDGDHLYAVNGSNITIISGFNQLELNGEGSTTPIIGQPGISLTQRNISIPGQASLEGISVDRNDPNHILVVSGGYGSANKVWRITNVLSGSPVITPLHTSDEFLPYMPIFDCVIDRLNPDRYILGTELGIWASDDAGQTWSEQNGGLFGMRMPIFSLRQFSLYEDNCPVLYAGTHGRGIIRSTSLTPGGCDLVAKGPPPEEDPTSIAEVSQVVSNIHIYPNPVQSEANIQFDMKEAGNVSLSVVDLMGRVVMRESYNNFAVGSQEIRLNASNLSTGSYLVVLKSNNNAFNSNIFIKK